MTSMTSIGAECWRQGRPLLRTSAQVVEDQPAHVSRNCPENKDSWAIDAAGIAHGTFTTAMPAFAVYTENFEVA